MRAPVTPQLGGAAEFGLVHCPIGSPTTRTMNRPAKIGRPLKRPLWHAPRLWGALFQQGDSSPGLRQDSSCPPGGSVSALTPPRLRRSPLRRFFWCDRRDSDISNSSGSRSTQASCRWQLMWERLVMDRVGGRQSAAALPTDGVRAPSLGAAPRKEVVQQCLNVWRVVRW